MRVAKAGFWASVFGFGLSGISLITGHPGVALIIINTTFFVATVASLFGLFLKSE